jgi:DNA-binding response OmpR family regulator
MDKKHLILIVDDEEHILNSLKIYLTMEGFEVAIADRGKKALEFIEGTKPSLILLDIMMPEMDGFEVLSSIRKNDSMKDIPVVMVTAKSQDEDILKGYKEQVSSYITKPFNLDELVGTINTILSSKK